MTRRTAGSPRGVPRIWLLPLLVLLIVAGLVAAGVLGRALILDLVAWWPVWIVLVLVVVGFRRRRIGRLRVGALVALFVAGALITFVVAHVRGWPMNPSASRYLVGPEPSGVSQAELIATVDGELAIRVGSEFLYEVDPVPGGGELGIPSAEERALEDSVSVSLLAPPDPGLDSFAGWDIRLSSSPRWALQLQGDLNADLTNLVLVELEMSGTGSVTLGVAEAATPLTFEGAFKLDVPQGAAVTVEGMARVPSTWERTTGGWRSPSGGLGWVISVTEGSVVSIVET